MIAASAVLLLLALTGASAQADGVLLLLVLLGVVLYSVIAAGGRWPVNRAGAWSGGRLVPALTDSARIGILERSLLAAFFGAARLYVGRHGKSSSLHCGPLRGQ
jgi:hypothetical protein